MTSDLPPPEDPVLCSDPANPPASSSSSSPPPPPQTVVDPAHPSSSSSSLSPSVNKDTTERLPARSPTPPRNDKSDYSSPPPKERRRRSPDRGEDGPDRDDPPYSSRSSRGYAADSKTKLYVGGLTPKIEKRDLEDVFERCGPLVGVEIRHGGFAFVEYEDARDAEDAVRKLCDYELCGARLLVEFSRSRHGGGGGGGGGCFLCGAVGHWARECPDSRSRGMDVRSGLCFRCGQPGHLARHCSGGHHPAPDPYYGSHGGRDRYRSPPRRRRSPSPYGRSGHGGYDRRRSPVYNDYRGGPGYDDRRY